MRVLVTGVAGLYGVHAVQEFLSHDEVTRVFGVDDFSRGFPLEEELLSSPWVKKLHLTRQRFQELSVKELNSLNLDVIIHLAGYNSGRESFNTPEEYFLNNEYGTFKLIQAIMRTKNRPFFVYASTTEVYGTPLYEPVDENHPLNPDNVYAVTKMAAERHVLAVGKCHNYPVSVLRFSNTFGENHNMCGYTSVVASFLDRALRNEPLIIYGSGRQTRDFLYVKDAVRALYLVVSQPKKAEGKVFNVTSGHTTSVCGLAQKVKEITHSTSEIIKLPCERIDYFGSAIDSSKACDILGWVPVYSLREALERTACWQKGVQSL